MKVSELILLFGGTLFHGGKGKERIIHEVKIDSRDVEKDDVFIALKGNHYDGHDFIESAISRGAALIVVEKPVNVKKGKVPIVQVENTFDALWQYASYLREKYSVPLVAITGSAGKTTTKEFIAAILNAKYHVLKNMGNQNNHIGVPLTLAKLNAETQIAVIEMGMNHEKEIAKLSKLCKPDMGVITNIGTSHIGNLGSRKNIFRAKMELIEGMTGGVLFVNGDDTYLKKVKLAGMNLCKSGQNKNNHLRAKKVKSDFEKTQFEIEIAHKTYLVEIPLGGSHVVTDALLAIHVGLYFGLPIETILATLKQFELPVTKRMHVLSLPHQVRLIDDCYNASYESFLSGLALLNHSDKEKLLILGDILELGTYRKQIHLKLAHHLKKMKHTKLLLVGESMRFVAQKLPKNAIHFESNQELCHYLDSIFIENCDILLKGSRGMKLEEIKETILKQCN